MKGTLGAAAPAPRVRICEILKQRLDAIVFVTP